MKVEKGERENIKYMFFVPILSKYLRFSHFDLQMIWLMDKSMTRTVEMQN